MSFRYVSIHGIQYATADADFVHEDTHALLEGQLLETQIHHLLNAHFHIPTKNEWGLTLPKHRMVDELVKRHDRLNDPEWSMKHCAGCNTCKRLGLCPRILSDKDTPRYDKDYHKPTYRNIGGKFINDKSEIHIDCSTDEMIPMDLEPTVVVVEDTTLDNIRRQRERKLKKQRRKIVQKADTGLMSDSEKRATLGSITIREYPWGALNASDGSSTDVYHVNPLLSMLLFVVKIPSVPSYRISKYLKPLADILRTSYTEVVGKHTIVQHDTAIFTAATTDKHIPALFKEFGMKPSTVRMPCHLFVTLFSAYVTNTAYRPYPFLQHSFTKQPNSIRIDDPTDFNDVKIPVPVDATMETAQYDKDTRSVVFSMEGSILRRFMMPPPSDTKAKSHVELFCDICNEYGHDSSYEFHRTHEINLRTMRYIRADTIDTSKDKAEDSSKTSTFRRIHEYIVFNDKTEYVSFYVPRSINRFHKQTQAYEDYEPPIQIISPERLEYDLQLVAVVTDDRQLYFRYTKEDGGKQVWYHFNSEFSPVFDTSFYKEIGSFANLMKYANRAVSRRGTFYLYRKASFG